MWSTILKAAIGSVVLTSIATTAVAKDNCAMSFAFAQRDESGTVKRPVWASSGNDALFFADTPKINTDGTKRSYSVPDFWGDGSGNPPAINNLCNAMTDACAGLSNAQLRARRILTQHAYANGWPADELATSRIARNVIIFKNTNKPCDPVDGYLVSGTSLHVPQIADPCKLSNYVDALAVPAIVLPLPIGTTPTGFDSRNAKVGDIAAVLAPDGKTIYFAVVGDQGPAKELGEISVKLSKDILGKRDDPKTYRELTRTKAWRMGVSGFVVFPGTRDHGNPYLQANRIEAAGREALARFGGEGGLPAGEARLRACMAAYRGH